MRHPLATALVATLLVCAAGDADAFCGFYVGEAGAKGGLFSDATQVVLMRHGTTTVLSMQNAYRGPPEGFALVVPVPVVVKEGDVQTLSRDLFDKVDLLGSPRLVEYWERDPCYEPPPPEPEPQDDQRAQPSTDSGGSSGGGSYVPPPPAVVVEARFAVGEYEIVVLSATESTALETWLRTHDYAIPKKAEKLLRPYIESGSKFFVARVDPEKVRFADGLAMLSPLRVVHDSPEFTLPIRLGMANSSGSQDLIVNIISPGVVRYEVANRPNVTIPTNLTVTDAARDHFGEFYAALFEHTLKRVPGAVVTEYAWDTGSCDPCPGPTIDPAELATLGYDALARQYGYLWGFSLTRLHLRYGGDTSDDLVFRAVQPIAGGDGVPDAAGHLGDSGARADGTNRFQARYAILHRWPEPVTCPSPQRGLWDGPPAGARMAAPMRSRTPAEFTPFPDYSGWSGGGGGGGGGGLYGPEVMPKPLPRKPHGCGCSSGGAGEGLMLVAAVTALLRSRRRRP